MAFITTLNAVAGTPKPVTVYDSAGIPLDPATVTWTGIPAGVTITPNATGFNFLGTVAASFTATANSNGAVGTLLVSMAAAPLKFTSP